MPRQPERPPSMADTSKIPPTDLTHLLDPDDNRRTWVHVEMDDESQARWLVFGAASLMPFPDRRDGRWILEGCISGNVTDFEHSTARLARLPLIGLQFQHTSQGQARFVAWVDPNLDPGYHSDFHVPRPGYDPRTHAKTSKCDDPHCSNKGHLVVPEGFYVPPFDLDLYKLVRGKKVLLILGTKG
jgi:hypothetical protein